MRHPANRGMRCPIAIARNQYATFFPRLQCRTHRIKYIIGIECFREFLDAYKKEARDSARIIKRLGLVEARGRNKERS